MSYIHQPGTWNVPGATVWVELYSDALVMHTDTYGGGTTSRTHSCASSIMRQANKADLTREKAFSDKGESSTE